MDENCTSSAIVTTSDDSFEAESVTARSEMETDYEESEAGRDNIYHEICESNRKWV